MLLSGRFFLDFPFFTKDAGQAIIDPTYSSNLSSRYNYLEKQHSSTCAQGSARPIFSHMRRTSNRRKQASTREVKKYRKEHLHIFPTCDEENEKPIARANMAFHPQRHTKRKLFTTTQTIREMSCHLHSSFDRPCQNNQRNNILCRSPNYCCNCSPVSFVTSTFNRRKRVPIEMKA